MTCRRRVIALGAWSLAAPCLSRTFVDPAEEPAPSGGALPARSPLLAVARAGPRLVAVGLRGRIVASDDVGERWTQANAPTAVDLTSVSFADASHGWAGGHAGLLLATHDGGRTWSRIGPRPASREGIAQPMAQPFLDVLCESASSGLAVGAFNTAWRTEDGGATWASWSDRTANPQELHFYAARGRAGRVFLAGEQGMVWRLQADGRGFEPVPTPYKGTLFGLVVADGGFVLAYGMRGAAWRSDDDGASWQRATLESSAGVTGGIALDDGRIVLVDQAGAVHVSGDGGRRFEAIRPAPVLPWYAVAAARPGALLLAGAAGTRVVSLQ